MTVVDDLSSGRESNLRAAREHGATLRPADVSHREATPAIFRDFEPEVVCPLAAQIGVRESVAESVCDARINVGGAASVLEAAQLTGARRVVFASTGGALYPLATARGSLDAVRQGSTSAPGPPRGHRRPVGEAAAS